MTSSSHLLSKDNSKVLRGMAILAIMLHNFLHLKMFGFCQENEMSFSQENADVFFERISNPGFGTVCELFSFLGWLGVPVFVFLTGFGLSSNYPPPPYQMDGRKYLRKSYLKLLFLLLPAVLFFFCYDFIEGAWGNVVKRIIQPTMLSNFDYPDLRVSPGVYWYFSLTFQYYVLYYFFRKYQSSICLLTVSAISLLLLYMLIQVDMPHALSIYRHCFPGWLPLFALGIWFARNDRISTLIEQMPKYVAYILLVTLSAFVVLMNMNVELWIFVPIVSLFFFMTLGRLVYRTRYMGGLFKWLGGYSAFIFVCHPIAREIMFSLNIPAYGLCISLLVYLLLTFVIACVYEKLYKKLSAKYIK